MRWIVLCCLLLAVAIPSRAGQAERRGALRAAFDAAEQGQLDLGQARRFNADPLYGWLLATVERRGIGVATESEIAPILQRLEDQAAGRWLRDSWLAELVRRQDWPAFRRAYRDSDIPLFRCADLTARMGDGSSGPSSPEPRWIVDARALWLTGESLPDECDAPFVRLSQIGQLDEALRWQRVDLAAAKGQSALIRHIAKAMNPENAALAQSYAAYLDAPGATVPESWGKGGRSRAVATAALMRLAKRDPDRADALLGPVADRLGLDDGQRGRVRYEVALWTVASYLPGAAARMAAVPGSAFDDKLHEWQVREAINRGADAAALAAIVRMGDTQRNDSHWQYFEARLRERLGQADAAHSLYEKAARSPTFHGWLAADRLQRPYVLCALEPVADRMLVRRVAENPALSRALDLVAIDRAELAAREWASAVKALSDDERRLAVQRAIADGWYDRAVFGMGVVPDDLRHYSLRFPLHHEADIRRQSQVNALDPAWVAGQARAESSFMPKARSPADARGLMQ
ncbi:MAG: transglycosylase SLT domain-containing protein, partial [Arenimonas sp.]